ncbi:MAG: glycosyltransferase family 4 protein [Bacteroidota bacterium]
MRKNILYIHFYASLYINKEAFIKEQASSLSYKTELGKTHAIHYLLNNNLAFNEPYELIQLISKKTGHLTFLKKAINYIKTNKCEYVIIHGLDYFLEAAYIKWASGAKIILQHHAEKTYLRKKAILMPLADHWVDGYLFNGKEIAQPFLQKKCISSVNKVYEVVEGSSNFQLLSDNKTETIKKLVFIGRLNENKNLITLLKAITILKTKRSDVHLYVYYTSNEQEPELKMYCKKNQINHMVTFKGSVSQNEIETILNQSHVFVSCSLYEGSGYSLIEALACGTFPIVSHIPAFDFLLKGLEEKEQFDPKNEMELATKLFKVLDTEFTTTRKETIRKHFENKCSNKAIALQIENMLQHLT